MSPFVRPTAGVQRMDISRFARRKNRKVLGSGLFSRNICMTRDCFSMMTGECTSYMGNIPYI